MERCEFCESTAQPIATQDMGEGRTMKLCPACRQRIEDGNAREIPSRE